MQVSFSLVIVGLDSSGKTTLISSLRNAPTQIFPTPGLQISYLSIQKIPKQVLIYDCSGSGLHRSNWKTFYSYVDAVMFVVDVTDTGRLKFAKQQLQLLIKNQTVTARKLPICVVLSKCDKAHASKQIYYQALEVEALEKKYQYKICLKETSAFTKQGVEDCFLWVQSSI